MGLPGESTERQLVQVDIASLSMKDLPRTYTEYGERIWKAFHLGRKDKELELEEIGAQEKRSDE